MYQLLRHDAPYQIEVFRSLEDAFGYLELDVETRTVLSNRFT